ncbi:gluconokinase [Gracilibacillus thailandensis]|uniref:Gluconokinase n=1 Tax=Gracilibacillus thailandensis TaxID=563735 RepID=A0A6N7R128_9BACI|nr:gluconokinase [Gracilibacillus thailandensis]MRI66019.1 gluconokinase [Gracilibacillus thailandensis]
MSNVMIGVDIGTTSTKAVVFNNNGEALSRASVEYPLHTPKPEVAAQNPEEIFQAVLTTIKESMKEAKIAGNNVQFISFSSAMHSLMVVNHNGEPLTNSITWADNRSFHYMEKVKQAYNGHQIYLRTGTPIHPMSPLLKLVWLKEEHPELFKPDHKFISIKEYVFYRLFGQYMIDYSIASATGMFHLEQLDWDQEVLELLQINKEQLSTPVATTHFITGLHPPYAEELGLPSDLPFILGASDGVLSNLGVNAIEPGVVALTIGTSGAIRTVTNKPVTDPKGRIFCYALTDKHWVIGGPVNNGGMIFRWLKEELGQAEVEKAKQTGESPYDLLTALAETVPAGSEGLLFHPYLTGERAPLWNANARGSFFGLAMHHNKKEHMIRAVLEGIMMNLYSVLLALEELIGEPKRIQATGGFARSPFWRQMLADIFDQEVMVPESFESSCLGAVVLGMYAKGDIDSLEEVKNMVGSVHSHHPNPDAAKIYQELMPIPIRIPRLLEQEYEAIANIQKQYTQA